MDRSAVPEQSQVPSYMLEKVAKKQDDLLACNVVGVQMNIEPQAMSARRNRDAGNGGDAISFVAVPQDRSFTRRGPCPADVGNEQEPAFVQECQMGPKSCGFFLSRAMWSSSIVRWPPRRARSPGVPVSGNSISIRATAASKHGRCDSAHRTPSRSTVRSFARSRVRWSTQGLRVLARESLRVAVSVPCLSEEAVLGWVLVEELSAHPCGRLGANERQSSETKQRLRLQSEMSCPLAKERSPVVSDLRAAHRFHVVSCPRLYHRCGFVSILYANLNSIDNLVLFHLDPPPGLARLRCGSR